MMATIGTKDFGHYRGMTTNQGFCKSVLFQCDGVSGHYREGGHTSGVAIKRVPLFITIIIIMIISL